MTPQIFVQRRCKLLERMSGGIVVLMGATGSPMNYSANQFPFVQDSSFRYFFRSNIPDLIGIIDIDEGISFLAGEDQRLDDIIWEGERSSVSDEAARAGIDRCLVPDQARELISRALALRRRVHFLPSYQEAITLRLAEMTRQFPRSINLRSSSELISSIVALREVKRPEEIAAVERTLDDTLEMHRLAMQVARPGRYEREIVAAMHRFAIERNSSFAYQPICTTRGEILHNTRYDRELAENDLVLNDTGLWGSEGYATDITRTFPVSGQFTPLQRDIYETVHRAQEAGIALCQAGRPYLEVHLAACITLVDGLAQIGIYKGDPVDVVHNGAHALFFQCGTGHQIGLDVHDMEALGEDHVGYDDKHRRSSQFGLAALRLAKKLRPGMLVTVEPGFYAIPLLLEQWAGERRFEQFINYDAIDRHDLVSFGGVRIEDMVEVTTEGPRLLGLNLPRARRDIEQLCSERA